MARLVQRATLAPALHEGPAAAEWRRRLPAETYTAVMVTSYLLEYRALADRAQASVAEDPLAAVTMARRAWEHLLMALLAGDGTFVWSWRWIPAGILRLDDESLAADARRGLFPTPNEPAATYVDWIRRGEACLARRAVRPGKRAQP
jgi:hypothetical protein